MKTYELDIDWQQLKEAKEELINANITSSYNFDGLIYLIDAIQDQAVENYGLSEEEIFNSNNH